VLADAIGPRLERARIDTHDATELTTLVALRAGRPALAPELADEAERLLGGRGTAATVRLGLLPTAEPGEVCETAVRRLVAWRLMQGGVMRDRPTRELCAAIVRTCEGILEEVETPSGDGLLGRLRVVPEPGASAGEESDDERRTG